MFEQAFKNIDDVLWKDSGVSNELDYVEQTSWILFLKYLDDFEKDKKTEAALAGKEYSFVIDPKFHWESWACPKNKEGKLDHNKALSGNDLKDFVTLQKTKTESENSWTVDIKDVSQKTFDLSLKNPNKNDETVLREPKEILEEMERLDKESKKILEKIIKNI